MGAWWSGLGQINRAFYGAAAFFSVFFLWQLLAAFTGLAGDHDGADSDAALSPDADAGLAEGGVGHDGTYAHFEQGAETDAAETAVAFKLLSIRSIITFFTLFTWGNALYLDRGESMAASMAYSTLWGGAGMISIALIFYLMRRLSETGTLDLATCVGSEGTVYVDIPPGGVGQVRTTVSGVISYVKARVAGGAELKSGRVVRILRCLGQTMIEVEPADAGRSS